MVLQEDGQYQQAAAAYRRVLDDFPEDRASWRNLGRVLYLDGKFESALDALESALSIDPEDRIAHYHVMLSLRALGRVDEAKIAEKAYNLEALKIHVHELKMKNVSNVKASL